MNEKNSSEKNVLGEISPEVLDLVQKTGPLSIEAVTEILASQDESCNPGQVGFYPDLEALAAKVRSSKNWSQGEVFVYAESEAEYVVMKQVAPSSCEMLTITHDGYKDVLTAYRYEQEELVDQLRSYMAGNEHALDDDCPWP